MARKGKDKKHARKSNYERHVEELEKRCMDELKRYPFSIRKKFTPYIHNSLEPYANVNVREPPLVISTTPRRYGASGALCRPTAISTLEDWKSLELEQALQLPNIQKKPLIQQEQTLPEIRLTLLEKLEEQLRIDQDEPSDPPPQPKKPKKKPRKKPKIRDSKSASQVPTVWPYIPERTCLVQTSRSVSTASDCLTDRSRVYQEKMTGSPPPSAYPRVSIPIQAGITRSHSYLNHDDLPRIRELVNKKNMKVNHLDKELADYLRTKHDYERFALHRCTERPKRKQTSKMEKAYRAYLQNTPGSSKAIRECLQGAYFLNKEAQNKEIRRFSSGGIGCL